MKQFKLFFIILVVFGGCKFTYASTADSLWEKIILANFKLLPEFHLEADLFTFFFHKNAEFKERYYLESNPKLSFALVSFRDFLYSVYDFEFQFGMGQTPGNVVFDPMEVNFGILPIIEYRNPMLILQGGLEHRCFHEIDRKELPTVYYNKLFLAAGSKNFRQFDYWLPLVKKNWTLPTRVSWYFRTGYFLKEFFGLVEPGKINGENDRVLESSLDLRYAFYKRRSWIVNGRYKGTFGTYDDGSTQAFWRQDFSIESNLRIGSRGGLWFFTYTLDKVPLYHGTERFSKDKLLQTGIRFFD